MAKSPQIDSPQTQAHPGFAATGVIRHPNGSNPEFWPMTYVGFTSVPQLDHIVEYEGKCYRVTEVRHIAKVAGENVSVIYNLTISNIVVNLVLIDPPSNQD